MVFENFEKYHMLCAYIESGKNEQNALNLYGQRFPERHLPFKDIFKRLESNLKMCGSFIKTRSHAYHKANRQVDETLVLGYVQTQSLQENSTSLVTLEQEVGVSKSRCQRILKKYKYIPYKVKITQELYPGDEERRTRFCQWYLGKCNEDLNFCANVIWTDESRFTCSGIVNRHNERFWNNTNAHLTRPVRQQGRFGYNVSCFIKGNKFAYHIFENNLNAERYLEILEINLLQLLHDEPLQQRLNLYFQQDGAPSHNAYIIRDYLNRRFPGKWIGTYGPINWPPRSPDLTPPDFFLWGVLKSKIYKQTILSNEQLLNLIHAAFREIKPIHISNAVRSIEKRCRQCIQNNGGPFE